MSESWYLKAEQEGEVEFVDDLVMRDAYVHFEDMGDAYMLIVENGDQHIHVTIPANLRHKAWVFEQFVPQEDPGDKS